ncbi:MAG: glycosyltransferase family 4 protein [Gemmobacter sp.]|nr:glycosyltransferase family 4 protein [Gemmobacter sp.]
MKILAIHQGAELYGSDRSFAQSIAAFRRAWPDAEIVVRLGGRGPLEQLIGLHTDQIETTEFWVARKAGILRGAMMAFPRFLWRLPSILQDMRKNDLVYINTVVVLDYLLASQIAGQHVVLHVREIPPKSILGWMIRSAVRASRAGKIFNSSATAQAYELQDTERTAIVLNGVQGPHQPAPRVPEAVLKLALIGRISDWKGQDLAVEALSCLTADVQSRVHLRIVGSPFEGQEAIEHRLARTIRDNGLEAQVTLVPFSPDVSAEYAWADAVLVPSRRPEPFGRVAIEAMAQGRAVIAADHGGLTEIVEHDRSGLRFSPNDAAALAQAISRLVQEPETVARLGMGARARYDDCFTESAMVRALIAAISSMTTAKPTLETEAKRL